MSTTMKNEVQVDENVVKKLKSTLQQKGYEVVVLNSEKEVKNFINNRIPDEQIVGLGDSITTCRLNIRNILFAKGSIIFYSWDGAENYNRSIDTFESPTRPTYYLSRINAITEAGDILMKDYSREASAENTFPEKMFLFAGMNRLCADFEPRESIEKYTILNKAPQNANLTVALLPFLCY